MSLFLNHFLRTTAYRSPLLRTLVPTIGLAFALQAAFAVPSIALQSDRVYDLSGSVTYLGVTALSLYLPALRARAASTLTSRASEVAPSVLRALGAANWRQLVLSAAVGVWAVRLGAHLFTRILKNGPDSRFDEIKKSPPKFAVAWFFQAVWVSLCLSPILALNALSPALLKSLPLLVTDVLGLSLFVGGLGFEIVADQQKTEWMKQKKEKKHDEDFLTSGLWGVSRHPNYFGESILWSGIAIAAGGVIVRDLGQNGLGLSTLGGRGRLLGVGLAAVSPAFVTFLLTCVSGVPMSEGKYDERYGDREDYKRWKRETPVFIPRFW
ncbi:hypothetical protein BJ878DRAFT_583171 [Calycina marina]|uniref:Steroid 5-alpha reductase C-terminal domain-containing protein n=1 Tax=Calycina marina TaxID=1763456 RepID=A0A9P7Z193_9HELO|nr:hypothetical protein BJ878DRAFT_583171 [Calycina marina]